jgi:hypothetical protein
MGLAERYNLKRVPIFLSLHRRRGIAPPKSRPMPSFVLARRDPALNLPRYRRLAAVRLRG